MADNIDKDYEFASPDWNAVLKYLLTAGVAGSTIAGAAGLARLLRTQKYKGKGLTNWDDDTLYIYKNSSADPQDQADNSQHSPGWTLGMTAAGVPLAFGGGYALTSWLINKYLRYEAQKELDKAQLAFVNKSGYGVVKKAASGLTNFVNSNVKAPVDNVAGAVSGLALLFALASGYATHQYLSENWPVKEPEVLSKPKKIKVVGPEQMQELVGDQEVFKQAAYDDGVELSARLLCQMNKKASVTAQIVDAVAQGRLQEFEQAVDNIGFVDALNLVKGASMSKTNPIAEQLAITYCTKFASFSPQFKLTAAAEYQAFHPEFCKQAQDSSDTCKLFLGSFATDINKAICHDLAAELIGGDEDTICKSASTEFIDQAFISVINKIAASEVLDNSDIQSSELSNGGQVEASKKDAQEISQETKAYNQAQVQAQDDTSQDPIDQVMAQPKKERELQASKDSLPGDQEYNQSSILQTS